MKRLSILLLAWSLAFIAPARAVALLPTTPITGPVTAAVGPVFQLRNTSGSAYPSTLTVQANFVYGSGGLTASVWLQTSLDGGSTWTDVALLSFTTSSARLIQSLTSAYVTGQAATGLVPTDGAMTSTPGFVQGVFGNLWRVKFTTTGTYAGGTTLRVDVVGNGLTAQ